MNTQAKPTPISEMTLHDFAALAPDKLTWSIYSTSPTAEFKSDDARLDIYWDTTGDEHGWSWRLITYFDDDFGDEINTEEGSLDSLTELHDLFEALTP